MCTPIKLKIYHDNPTPSSKMLIITNASLTLKLLPVLWLVNCGSKAFILGLYHATTQWDKMAEFYQSYFGAFLECSYCYRHIFEFIYKAVMLTPRASAILYFASRLLVQSQIYTSCLLMNFILISISRLHYNIISCRFPLTSIWTEYVRCVKNYDNQS